MSCMIERVKIVVCRATRHAQGHGPVVCGSSNTRQLGCVSQDMEPPKSSSILRKSSNTRKQIGCVRFTKPSYVTLTFETKIHRLPVDPRQRSFNAPRFEDRSQEETVARAMCP